MYLVYYYSTAQLHFRPPFKSPTLSAVVTECLQPAFSLLHKETRC